MKAEKLPVPDGSTRGRSPRPLFSLSALFAGFALAVAGLGVVAAGLLQSASAPGAFVPEPAATLGITPEPAVTASPSLSAGGESIYAAPVIAIEPPPAPASTGYFGLTAAKYCALRPAPYSTSGSDPTAFLTAANKERARTGAPPLTWNATLASFAQSWSAQMAADQDAHPEWLWASAEWYAGVFRHSGGPYAENIAVNWGYSNPVNEAQRGWMGSTGHCKTIMNPNYTQMGAGKAQAADGTWYFTEEFSR